MAESELAILNWEAEVPCSICFYDAALSGHTDHWAPAPQSMNSKLFVVTTEDTEHTAQAWEVLNLERDLGIDGTTR